MLARFLRIIVIVPGLMSGFATFAARHLGGLPSSNTGARRAAMELPRSASLLSAQELAKAQTIVQNHLRTWAQDENRYDVFSRVRQAVLALCQGIYNPRDFARVPERIDTILGMLPAAGVSHGESMAVADIRSILTHIREQVRQHEPNHRNHVNTWRPEPGNIGQVERVLSNLFGVMRNEEVARAIELQPENVAIPDRLAVYREALLHVRGRDDESIFTTISNHVDMASRERNRANVNNLLLDLRQRLYTAELRSQAAQSSSRFIANIGSHIYRFNGLLPFAVAPRCGLRTVLAAVSRIVHYCRGNRLREERPPVVLGIVDAVVRTHNDIDQGLGAVLRGVGIDNQIPAGAFAHILRGLTDDLGVLLRHPETNGVFREVDQTLQDVAARAEDIAAQSVISPDLRNLLHEMGEAWFRPITPAPITPAPMAPANSESTHEMNDQLEPVAAPTLTAVRDLNRAPVFRDLGNLDNDQYMPDDYVRQSEHEDDQLEEPGIGDDVAEPVVAEPRRTYLGQVAAYMWSFVPNFRYDDVG